jgi:hypothetical protein
MTDRPSNRVTSRKVTITNLSVRNEKSLYRLKSLSDEQQGHIGNDIEHYKNDFEQPEKRVNDYVEGFSGNVKPFAMYTIQKIRD